MPSISTQLIALFGAAVVISSIGLGLCAIGSAFLLLSLLTQPNVFGIHNAAIYSALISTVGFGVGTYILAKIGMDIIEAA